MKLGDDFSAAIAEVSSEWNRAEKAIKLAEEVSGEIINPAIYELRYAGRRIVEALAKASDGAEENARLLLRDALFDCCRARHDAIDAATSKISADLDLAVKKLGPDTVLQNFPKITDLLGELGAVRDKIAMSREKRDDRDAIYDSIERDRLTDIVGLFRTFRASEPLMKAAAKKQRRRNAANYGLGAVGALLAALGIILTLLAG
jgi:hypothetical protein